MDKNYWFILGILIGIFLGVEFSIVVTIIMKGVGCVA